MQLLEWIDSYNTDNTKQAANKTIIAWNKHWEHKQIQEEQLILDMKKQDEDFRYQALTDFKNNYPKFNPVAQTTMKQYMAFLPKYLRMVHGVKIDRDELQIFTGKQKIPKVDRTPFTKDLIKMICHASNDVHKTVYLVLSSSGQRISETLLNKEKNYHLDEVPARVVIPAEITKTKSARITFLSKEAVTALKNNPDYWERKNLNSEEAYFARIRKKVGLLEKYPNSINYLYNIHSIRAFFRTEAGKINHDFAEKVLGHESFDTHYVRLSDQEKAEYYLKLEPKIRIF